MRYALADLTTLRLGGPARRLVAAETEAALIRAVCDADNAGEPVLVLGGGSNVVVGDAGFDGTVVHVQTRGITRVGETLTVAAGEPWDAVVEHAVGEGLAGIECLSGIPGATGATPIQNVGAYGQDVSETINSIRVLDRASGEVREMAPEAIGFRYRTSVLKGRDSHVVLAVSFGLRAGERSRPVRYAELAKALGIDEGGDAALAEVREAVLLLRRGKGMVLDRADPDSVSAGSFFTNPIVDEARLPEGAPRWPQADGLIKVSAAWLIEHAGFSRGLQRGRVGISTKHTLALVNRGDASTEELLTLAREIAAGVQAKFGIELRPEPVFVGVSW